AVSWPFALGHWRPDGDADSQYRFSLPGVDGDRAAVALHDDAPCDVEAQAGAFADILGRVKGLERAGRHVRRHARAGVADLDDDVVPLGPGRQPERARAGHGVDGVVDKVGPHLVQLAGVCLDPRDVCAADGQPVARTARLQLIVVLRWKLPGGRPGPRRARPSARRRRAGPCLALADHEEAVASWLSRHGIICEWMIAPPLAAAGVTLAWCERVALVLQGPAPGPGLEWIASTLSGATLLSELKDSSRRISELVAAIKSYSQMDRASVQDIDVTDGIESTLLMLGYK